MEHMKFIHKDPNASGVPGKYYLNKILYKEMHMKFIHKDPNASGVPGKYYLNKILYKEMHMKFIYKKNLFLECVLSRHENSVKLFTKFYLFLF
jgi:hypothetical protein